MFFSVNHHYDDSDYYDMESEEEETEESPNKEDDSVLYAYRNQNSNESKFWHEQIARCLTS